MLPSTTGCRKGAPRKFGSHADALSIEKCQVIRYLIDSGANLDPMCNVDEKPLHAATWYLREEAILHRDAVKLLVEKGLIDWP